MKINPIGELSIAEPDENGLTLELPCLQLQY